MALQEYDGKFIYYFYEVDAMGEPEVVPFERLVQYVNDHPETQFFIFAKRCTKEDVDTWFNNEHVTVHWWKDMTPTPGTDPLSIFVQSVDPVKPNFGGILEVSSSISPEELHSLYTLADGRPSGNLMIARNSDLPKKAIELYEETFKSDLKLEKHKVFHRELFNGWALVEFDNDNEGEMAPPERSEYLLFYSGSDLDESFIDWGEIIGRHIVKY